MSGRIAIPRPFFGLRDDLGPHRIQHDVATEFQQVALLVDKDTLESPLQDMADVVMPTVRGLGIHAVQAPRAVTEVRLGGFQQEMVMVAHQAVGVASPLLLGNLACEQLEEAHPIAVALVDGLTAVPASCDVVQRAFELHPQLPSHDGQALDPERVQSQRAVAQIPAFMVSGLVISSTL